MSSRHSARSAAAVAQPAAALSPLPLPLVHRIFLALRVDERARAACVCRAWRDAIAEPELWAELDLGDAPSGLVVSDAALRAFATRAQGHLRLLRVGYIRKEPHALLALVAANGQSLRELQVGESRGPVGLGDLEALARAAPNLRVLDACVQCNYTDAVRVLRAQPPLAALRLDTLAVSFKDGGDDGALFGSFHAVAPVAAALSDAALQPTLARLVVDDANCGAGDVLGTLVDAVLSRRLERLELRGCVSPAGAPLARLLHGNVLRALEISDSSFIFNRPWFGSDDGATLVADALRANTTLTTLWMTGTMLFRDMQASCELLRGLVGHSSLRSLYIKGEDYIPEPVALGAALAAIVAANAPALRFMGVASLALGDLGLAPLVEALRLNSNLRSLNISGNHMSSEFARDRLLPAVRVNTGLRPYGGRESRSRRFALVCSGDDYGISTNQYTQEAEYIVDSR